MPHCKLTIREGDRSRIVLVNEWVIEIGRAAPSDIVLPSPTISNPHCRLLRTERGFVLEDSGSETGSFVNGSRVTSLALSPGDEIRLGDVTIRYELDEESHEFPPGSAGQDPTMTFRLDFKGQEAAAGHLFGGKDAAARMAFLYAFTRSASALDGEDALLDDAASALCRLPSVRRSRIITHDTGAASLRCRADAGDDAGARTPEQEFRMIERSGARERGEAILCRTNAAGQRRARGPDAALSPSGDFIAAPLCREEGVFGWLTLSADPGSSAFTRQDLEFAAVFGDLLEREIDRHRSRRLVQADNEAMREVLGDDRALVGDSAPMRALAERIRLAAASEAAILIVGESGTGKELAARALHAGGRRRREAFVSVNCAVLQHDLLASDLFGHVKGSFTGATGDRAGKFELADGGTLFFDEIGEMPYPLQAKLLRALQEGEIERVGEGKPRQVDVRVLAATNRDLHAEVEKGTFRKDLYFRLAVVEIRMPPLRERAGDVALLFDHYLGILSKRSGRPRPRVPREIMEALEAHDWPGNVRELRNLAERCVAMCPASGEISLDDLPIAIAGRAAQAPARPVTLEDLERRHIAATLASCGGNKSQTARLLGIDRSTLYEKMEKYRLG